MLVANYSCSIPLLELVRCVQLIIISIIVVLKISLCKAVAISSHWWLQQWPVRLRCSVSLQLINCLDV